MPLRELARRTGLDPTHLSRIERGLTTPSLKNLHAIAKGLDLRELAAFLAPYLPRSTDEA